MKSNKELKRLARESLGGKYKIAIGALIFASLIPMIIEYPFSGMISGAAPSRSQFIIYYIVDVLVTVLSGVLTIGKCLVHLNIARGIETRPAHVFTFFKTQTDRYIIAYFLYFLITLVSTIPSMYGLFLYRRNNDLTSMYACIALLVLSWILGVLVSLFYGLLLFVLVDYQNLGVLDCFRQARALMVGKKGRYFYTILSFIGLELLSILSFGIGLLWIEPYRQQTFTFFYLNAIGELDNNIELDKNEESSQ